jgi:hypothetical protein
MENLTETIYEIKNHIKSKGHNISDKTIELYYKFLFENSFINSELLLEVFERDFYEINIEIIDKKSLTIKWLQVENVITTANQTLIILLLSHDEEEIRRGNQMPEKLALYDGLVFYATKNIPRFGLIFDLIKRHKK